MFGGYPTWYPYVSYAASYEVVGIYTYFRVNDGPLLGVL